MKNVAVSLMAILFAACSGNKSPHSLQQEKEDLSAKELLQEFGWTMKQRAR